MTSTKCLFQNDFNHPSTVFLPGWPVSCGQVLVNATHPEEQLRPSDILLLLLYQTRPPCESRLPGRDGLRGRQTRCICRCASGDGGLGEPSTWSGFTRGERAVYSQLLDRDRVCRWQWGQPTPLVILRALGSLGQRGEHASAPCTAAVAVAKNLDVYRAVQHSLYSM